MRAFFLIKKIKNLISLFVLNFDLKIKIEFGLGLVAIKFGFGYKFANWKSSTQIEFEIYNDFENCLATSANTRNVFFS